MLGRALAAALAAATCAACDEPLLCDGAFVERRSPLSLTCVSFQLPSASCPELTLPAWPVCRHPCEEIADELACRDAAGCRVVRELCDVFDDRCLREGPFIGCYPIGTSAPAEGACGELGATACATREDCGGQYVHGPECGPAPAAPGTPSSATSTPPVGPDCHFSFVACFDERAPP